ncbi:hypothetical protein DPMN_145704 [Dreissena polymorpha]|uniref:Uncharacterized protein n=1 Tax=Dreissena polymorpha TaxID=45954 RepID=A0A9D4J1G3_DREPO|nr:hypothetical protein DPMN_145704 [Dreissena polymorpha]
MTRDENSICSSIMKVATVALLSVVCVLGAIIGAQANYGFGYGDYNYVPIGYGGGFGNNNGGNNGGGFGNGGWRKNHFIIF